MIRVLALSTDVDGVGYYRCLNPHLCINESDIVVDVRLFMDGTLNLLDENFLRSYNIIFLNKVIPFNKPEYTPMFFDLCKKTGVKVVYDIDDFWILNSSHLNYDTWKRSGGDKNILNMLKSADVVTTTTPIFADRIKQENKNVVVLENAVNLNEQQWSYDRKSSSKIRFLWGGGISHIADLRLLTKSFEMFQKDKNGFLDGAQLYMCGFDLRMRTPHGTVPVSDWRTNQWTFFEDMFTYKGRYIKNNEHRKFLISYNDKNYGYKEEFVDEFYQRRWTRPIMNYGHMYNEADVCLSPLRNNNMFNLYKSNLKVIEAGAHKCPIIASNYGPYTWDDIEGKKDGKQKGFLIDENDTTGWHEKMIYYFENPSIMLEHGENLYDYVKNNLSMDVVGKKRCDLYRKICN